MGKVEQKIVDFYTQVALTPNYVAEFQTAIEDALADQQRTERDLATQARIRDQEGLRATRPTPRPRPGRHLSRREDSRAPRQPAAQASQPWLSVWKP
ncbi:hypothetical protein [Nocardioides convexus]|uniref:hypothetical protein n=1 Tax=Nocardioides convexus TaxID=2712224 RepID=UPI0024186AE5|nr:hypothetical protein [Nocardioides convexus]